MTPVLRRSKPTTVHECAAKQCVEDNRTICPNSCYISVPAKNKDLNPHLRFKHFETIHVSCFLAQHPGVRLQDLKGYERNGAAAQEQLGPAKTLWDFLAE